jgi:PAS domain S-box-containing protein
MRSRTCCSTSRHAEIAMSDLPRILIVEDLPADAELGERELRKAGVAFEARRVETRDEFLKALDDFQPDLVISDFKLPTFDGLSALSLTIERAPTTPVIIMAGSMNEETAVDCMKAGAADYVLKEHLGRLGPAVKHALDRRRAIEDAARGEHALRASHQFIQQILAGAQEGIAVVDSDKRCLMWNAYMEVHTGVPGSAVLGKHPWEVFPFLGPREAEAEFDRALEGEAFEAPDVFVEAPAPGHSGWYSRRFGPLRDAAGSIAGVIITARDVTERKQTEEKLSAFFDSNAIGVLFGDIHGNIHDANDEFLRIVGFDRDDLLAGRLRWLDITPPEFLPLDEAGFVEARAHGACKPYQKQYVRKDGSRVWVVVGFALLGERREQSIMFILDVSERKRAEEALAESEARFRAMVETAPIGIFLATPDGQTVYTNRADQQMTGLSAEEMMGPRWVQAIHPDDRDRVTAEWQACLRAGVAYAGAGRFLRPDGQVVWWDITTVPVTVDGRLLGYLGTIEDKTQRHLADEQIRNLTRAVEQSPVSIIITDTEGRIEYANPKFTEITGYRSEDVLGRNPRLLKSGATPPDVYRELWQTITAGREWRGEFENLKKNGDRFWEAAIISPVRDTAGTITHFVAVKEDITARRQTEQALRTSQDQLFQAQKMEAIGRLAGGVAHDFNNLLTAILGYGQFLLDGLAPDDERRADVAEIIAAGERAATLTRQLLAFSRRLVLEPRILDLNDVIANVSKLLRRVIGEDIEIEITAGEGLWPVQADPGQIEQVLMNLVLNARDAMPEGGRLTITTANATISPDVARMHPGLDPGPYVHFAIVDTGSGMTREVRAQIFEPFFTTKEQGKGTGLGLATVYGIVKQSNGYIWCASEPGRGTTFDVFLPQAAGEAEPLTPPVDEVDLRAQGETILLVEDDAAVRDLAVALLEDKGYVVLAAGTGAEALKIAAAHDGSIHLLLTDVVMPGMSGREVAERLTKTRPATPVLFMSGYMDEAIGHHGPSLAGARILQKPFTAATLARRVRETLAAAPTDRAS